MSRNFTLTASIATAAVALSAALGSVFLAPTGSPSAAGNNMPLHVRNLTSAGLLDDADVDTVIYKVDCDQSGANCKLGKEVAKKTKAEFTTKLRSGEYLLQAELSAAGKKKYYRIGDSDLVDPVPTDAVCESDRYDCIWIVVNGAQWSLKTDNGITLLDHADFEYAPLSGPTSTTSSTSTTVVDPPSTVPGGGAAEPIDDGEDVDIAVTPVPAPVAPPSATVPATPETPVDPLPEVPVDDAPAEDEPNEPVEEQPGDPEAIEQELIDEQPVEEQPEQDPVEEDVDSVFANPLTLGVPND
ncbi:MAG: hypothetical protein AAFY28_22465 [Actinomycetota bacterium]